MHSAPATSPSFPMNFIGLVRSVLDFLGACGEFLLAPAVDDDRLFCSQAERGAGGVHCYVPSTDCDHALADPDWSIVLREEKGTHQVGAGEELVC